MQNVIHEHSEIKDEKLKEHICNSPSLHKYFKLNCGLLNFDAQDYYLLPKISEKDEENNLDIFVYMLMKATKSEKLWKPTTKTRHNNFKYDN